ncbi:hypothetical protein NQ318_000202, partial [Aromia moschata]
RATFKGLNKYGTCFASQSSWPPPRWPSHGHLEYGIPIRGRLEDGRFWVYPNGTLSHITVIGLSDILYYYVFLIALVVYNSALFLRNNFRLLKNHLSDYVSVGADDNKITLYKSAGTDLILPRPVIAAETLGRLIETSTILNVLFECVDIFNTLFGAAILLICFSTVIGVLNALNILLIAGEKNNLTIDMVLHCLCKAFSFLLWNFFVISACGLLKKETELIVKLCCKIQHLLPQVSQERKEFLNLARQVSRRFRTISACGFFDVDFSLIFSIFSYVGTYIVVLIQFSHIDF